MLKTRIRNQNMDEMTKTFEQWYSKLPTMDDGDDWAKNYIFNGWMACWEHINRNKHTDGVREHTIRAGDVVNHILEDPSQI